MRKTAPSVESSAKPEYEFFPTVFGLALRAIDLPHDLVEDGISQPLPRGEHRALQSSNLLQQFRVTQSPGARIKPPPSFGCPGALAGQITWLPNHIDRTDDGHQDARNSDEGRAICLRNDCTKSRRSTEYLQEAEGRTRSPVKPSQPLPIFTPETGLKNQIISIRIYPYLSFHCLILLFPRPTGCRRPHYRVAALALAWSSLLLASLSRWMAWEFDCQKVLLPWSAPCEWFVGVGTNILSQGGPAAHIDNPEAA